MEKNSPEIKIVVVDSHRNLKNSYWNRLGAFYKKNVCRGSKKALADFVRQAFCSYETDYGVKWFEITAYAEKELVGCMRVLRNPVDEKGWFFCDVNTDSSYRRAGVASAMYEEGLKLVREFYAAEYVEASVDIKNDASVKLHEKHGFHDTGEYPEFAHFAFEESETMYRRTI